MTSLEGAMRSHSLYLRYRVTIVQSGSVQSYKSYTRYKVTVATNFLVARREFSARATGIFCSPLEVELL